MVKNTVRWCFPNDFSFMANSGDFFLFSLLTETLVELLEMKLTPCFCNLVPRSSDSDACSPQASNTLAFLPQYCSRQIAALRTWGCLYPAPCHSGLRAAVCPVTSNIAQWGRQGDYGKGIEYLGGVPTG